MTEHTITSHYNTIVVLLCGLPGSGKSTLAHQLGSSCRDDEDDTKITDVVHIEYDEVEAELLLPADDSASPVQNNGSVLSSLDVTASKSEEESTFTRDVWKKSRIKSLDLLTATLKEGEEESDNCTQSTKLILMDDNFHLRSMRREVYRVCQDFVGSRDAPRNIYFAVLWLDIPKQVCLERNQQRARSVPDHVVERMSETLEPPGKEGFEQCYKRITDLALVTSGDAVSEMNTVTTMSIIKDFVTKECVANYEPVPPPPAPIDLEQLEEERRKTRESWLHTWDQRLRSWVGKVAHISRKDTGNANKARKTLLETLRQELQQKGQLKELPSVDTICDWFLVAMEVEWSDEQLEQFHKATQEGQEHKRSFGDKKAT